MDIINLNIDRSRRRLWSYGAIALALIVGLTVLVGANRVSAHEGVTGDDEPSGIAIVQVYDAERDEHVVHTHASGVMTWEVYFGSSRVIECDSRQSGWREADESSRSSDIVTEADQFTLTLDSNDHNLGVCVRYTTEDVDDEDNFDPTRDWTYTDADTQTNSAAENSENLVVDLRGPTISIDAAESNMMEVEVDGLREGFVGLTADHDTTALLSSKLRVRYAFLDSAACDATTLTVDTRYKDGHTTNLVNGASDSQITSTITTAQAKDGLTFGIKTAWSTHGDYLCVEVTDQVGNAGHESMVVDVDFPLTLTQVPSTVSGEGDTGRVSISSSESGVQFSYSSNINNYQVNASSDCANTPAANGYVFRSSVPDGGYKYGIGTHSICVIARDANKNEVRVAFVIDQADPTISVVLQSNQIVYAIGSDDSSDTEAPIGVDVIRSSEGQVRWESRYIDALAYDGDDPDPGSALDDACVATNFKGNDDTYATYTTGTRNSRIDLSKNSAYRDRYDAVCFRISDAANQEYYLGVVLKDFDVLPVIEGMREEGSPMLDLSITGVEGTVAWSWDDAEISDDCSSEEADAFNFSEPSPDPTITVGDDVAAYCVRATIDTDNYYGIVVGVADGETLDNDGPIVTIGDVTSSNQLSATATDSVSGVDADSWQYTILADEDSARDDCNDDPLQVIADDAWMNGDNFQVNPSHRNMYVCFRVMDEVGNYGYASVVLPTVSDTTDPTLTVTQSGNTLDWDAQDDGGIATYEYQMFDSAPADCTTDSGWTDGQMTALAESDNGMHYCFRVTDHGDNFVTAGPLTISGVDTTAPTITVSQSANTVSAIPGELNTSGWQFYRSDTEPADCSSRFTGWGDVKQVEDGRRLDGLTAADSGKWVCFRVMDAAGNYGYKKFQIETITAADETTRVASDGSLQFNVEGSQLTVSLNPAEGETTAPTVISWNYLYWSTEELARNNCTADDNQFDAVAPGTRYSFSLQSRHLGNWFCFRAIDEDNEEAFGVFQAPGQTAVVTPPVTGPDEVVITPPVTVPGTEVPTPPATEQPGQPGDGTETPDPTDGTETPTPTPDPTDDGTADPDPGDPVDEGGFLSDYLWYIIGAVVVVILIVVFVAMGSKGNQRE